uniref:BPTI/Kunitz inhibitor domain-containing protein n=1 Tax=Amblyomma maculatum TaxID=34609 RepID=G3MLK2_AMBMU
MSTMLRLTVLAAVLLAISIHGANAQKPSFCNLPPSPGFCLAYFPSFYYDSSSGTCREFVYGGCQGNQNRFVSNEECLRVCG